MPPIEIFATMVVTILTSIIGSGGLWSYLTAKENRRTEERAKHSLERQALLGLLYDRLIHRCRRYIEREYITIDELEDLRRYLYEPYRAMGGNGTAEALMMIVNELPKHREEVNHEDEQ